VATSTYMNNRKKWSRPQAILFSNNPGTLSSGFYIPTGNEFEDFIVLSDHNRRELYFSKQRIENRQRMVNGTMRSYHTADKSTLSVAWTRLPSRAFSSEPTFIDGKLIQEPVYANPGSSPTGFLGLDPKDYTVDNGAGGADLMDWYESHPGPFWVFLSYDKFGENNLNRYTQVLQMYFGSFDYEVEKRGQDLYDMWNVSISLEEV
jgi:hypothetical protein